MEFVDVTVYYLEMLAAPPPSTEPPGQGIIVRHIPSPAVAYYRSLYDAVGKDYYWLSRRKLSDGALQAILSDPAVEMHVLHVDGVAAGFVELDRRQSNEIEIVQFGLTPEFIGRGLGKWFLNWIVDRAWSYQPSRLWLHTCTLDHPAAVPNYLKAGFAIVKEENIRRER